MAALEQRRCSFSKAVEGAEGNSWQEAEWQGQQGRPLLAGR